MRAWLKEFQQFILRGNVIDLAVGIVIGIAFKDLVLALVRDLVTPLIAAIFGEPDFSELTFVVNGSTFLYGDFINFLVTFALIALVLFFLIVKPVNAFVARARRRKQPADPTTTKCPHCRSEIAIDATRCAFCTSDLTTPAATEPSTVS